MAGYVFQGAEGGVGLLLKLVFALNAHDFCKAGSKLSLFLKKYLRTPWWLSQLSLQLQLRS